MTKEKKYNCRVAQGDTSWVAEIVRRVSSRETVVSKSQDGFSTEAEAQEWGGIELKLFMQNQNERNKRRSDRNKE